MPALAVFFPDSEDSMQEKRREEVALFRFGVISELVCRRLTSGEMAETTRLTLSL